MRMGKPRDGLGFTLEARQTFGISSSDDPPTTEAPTMRRNSWERRPRKRAW